MVDVRGVTEGELDRASWRLESGSHHVREAQTGLLPGA